jgi:hypothetical protein
VTLGLARGCIDLRNALAPGQDLSSRNYPLWQLTQQQSLTMRLGHTLEIAIGQCDQIPHPVPARLPRSAGTLRFESLQQRRAAILVMLSRAKQQARVE